MLKISGFFLATVFSTLGLATEFTMNCTSPVGMTMNLTFDGETETGTLGYEFEQEKLSMKIVGFAAPVTCPKSYHYFTDQKFQSEDTFMGFTTYTENGKTTGYIMYHDS